MPFQARNRAHASDGAGNAVEIGLGAGVEVVLDDPLAVRRVGEREVEQLRVAHALLKTVGRKPVLALRLDDGDREAGSDLEQVVRPERIAAPVLAAHDDDAPVGDRVLLDDLVRGPASVVEPGDDVVPAGLCLEGAEGRHRR